MAKISLEKFIENTKGTQVDVPWVNVPSKLKGQCVSLIQQYLVQCLEQPAKARGNAKDWIQSYVSEGLGYTVSDQRKGDILVFPHDGVINGVAYGHIAICVDENTIYDQNNFRHDNGACGYSNIFTNDYVVLRPYAKLEEESKPVEQPIRQRLYLPADAEKWRVYAMDKQPVAKINGKENATGFLLPSKFGGLEYDILGWTMPNVAIIQTRDFGQCQIYVAPETNAVIK